MKKEFVFSYDLGTSGVKAALVSLEGRVLDTATAEYPLYLPAPDMAEQEPTDYWNGVCAATRAVLEKTGIAPESVAGIAFGTQWKGIIPVSADGRVLHRSMIWMDARGSKEADELNERYHTNVFSATDIWARLAWIRRNRPELIDEAEMILDANAYLKWRATGEYATDVGDCAVRCASCLILQAYRRINSPALFLHMKRSAP